MSCYSVAEEITSIRADYRVELRGFELRCHWAIPLERRRDSRTHSGAPICGDSAQRVDLNPNELGQRILSAAKLHADTRRAPVRLESSARTRDQVDFGPRHLGSP